MTGRRVQVRWPQRAIQEFDLVLRGRPGTPPGEMQATALYGRGIAKRRIGAIEDGNKDIQASIKITPKAKERAAVFYRLKE